MALSFVSRIGASPLGRAGVAIFSILTLAGVVQFGLPLACGAGAALCRGEEPVALAALDEPVDAMAPSLEMASSAAAAVVAPLSAMAVAQVPAVLTYNDLIASTFAVLDGAVTAQPVTELTSRSVRTVTVNADGTPAASAPVAPLVAEAPVVSAPVSTEVSVESSAQERSTSLAYAPASGDVANVTGSGANVRSLPRKGGSEVLFALRGGEEVTIVQMSKGWAKIVDSQGRSGWIYGAYLDRS